MIWGAVSSERGEQATRCHTPSLQRSSLGGPQVTSMCSSSNHLEKTRKCCASSKYWPKSFLIAPRRCWIWPTGTEMAQPNYFGSYSCSVAPVRHFPAFLWSLCYCRPSTVSARAMKTSHSSKKHQPRELCSEKTKGSSCLTARTSHHVVNVWWQEKHQQGSLFSPAQGQGCTLHQGCAEPAGGSIQFPDPFLACP